jgi:signal transduction histidine kinase/ligand-binding sensor domain-containing protein
VPGVAGPVASVTAAPDPYEQQTETRNRLVESAMLPRSTPGVEGCLPRRRLIFITTLALFLLSQQLCPGQEKLLPVYQFNHLTTADGLPTNEIRSNVVRDRQGFVWFGTEIGLVRYDGYVCKVYPGFVTPGNAIALFIDSRDRLWVGTFAAGMSLYDPSRDRFVHFAPSKKDSTGVPARYVGAFYEDDSGMLWIGSDDPMLVRLDLGPTIAETNADSIYRHARASKIPCDEIGIFISKIVRWDEKSILLSASTGLFLIDRKTGTLSRPGLQMTTGLNLDTVAVRALCWETPQRLWIGTMLQGLFLLDRANGVLTSYGKGPTVQGNYSSKRIQGIQPDSNGRLWIATGDGLDLFDMRLRRFEEFLASADMPGGSSWTPMAFDDTGTLWISTIDDGLYFVPGNSKRFRRFSLRGRSGKAMTIETINPSHDGSHWFGGEGKLYRIRLDDRSVLEVVDLLKREKGLWRTRGVWTSCEDGRGNIWFGTFGLGLYRFEVNTSTVTNFHFSGHLAGWAMREEVCRSLLCVGGNSLWIAAYNDGLLMMDTERKSFSRVQSLPPTGQIIHLMRDNSGKVWISDEFLGLHVMDPSSGKIDHFEHDPNDTMSLSDLSAQATFQDSEGRIWIGCQDLNLWNPETRSFTRLPNPAFPDVTGAPPLGSDPQGRLWVRYMGKGIGVLDPKTNLFANFDQTDGAVDPFTLATLPGGKIVLAGVGGINIVEPESVFRNGLSPPLVITRVSISDSVSVSQHPLAALPLELQHDQNVVELEFAAIDPGAGHLIEYRYRLEGLEDSWIHPASRRFVRYPGLAPGKYIFRVKAISKLGRWPDQESTFAFSISPPWWHASWFRILAIGTMIGLLGFIYRRENARHRRDRALQEEFSRQQIESQEIERKHLASELHDGLGQDLLVMSNELQQFLQQADKPAEQLTAVATLLQESIDEIREISSNLHPHLLDRLGFCEAVSAMAERISHSAGIVIDLSCDDVDRLLSGGKELHIYRIIQEALSNAARHAGATRARLEVRRDPDKITVVIADDGHGFDVSKFLDQTPSRSPTGVSHGFGLSSMLERARILSGSLKFESSPGSGTTIRVTVPLR